MVLFDANTLMLLLDPALPAPKDKSTGEPVTEVEKRIKYLVDTLQESREKIVIPTPALAEVLTHAERADANYFIKLDRSAAFRIESFGSRAAIELARMTASAINAGDKRGGVSAPWNKVKFTPGKAGGLSSVSPSKGPKLAPPKGGCLANPAPCSTNRG